MSGTIGPIITGFGANSGNQMLKPPGTGNNRYDRHHASLPNLIKSLERAGWVGWDPREPTASKLDWSQMRECGISVNKKGAVDASDFGYIFGGKNAGSERIMTGKVHFPRALEAALHVIVTGAADTTGRNRVCAFKDNAGKVIAGSVGISLYNAVWRGKEDYVLVLSYVFYSAKDGTPVIENGSGNGFLVMSCSKKSNRAASAIREFLESAGLPNVHYAKYAAQREFVSAKQD